MGSKERIQRLKEENRINILEAAMQIVKEEGWQALSMRKIAEIIEYTAPMIYEYFTNKEALLSALAAQGYLQLAKKMCDAKERHAEPTQQLEAMWLAYWDFAFAEKELYQLMFGVGTQCCEQQKSFGGSNVHSKMVSEVIQEIMKDKQPSADILCQKYFTFWSVIHGLISINLVNEGLLGESNNQQILKDAIQGITRSLKD
ncbi:TetR/AcrR family transcriptional regulator [Parapedobacter tibetensis]|uniref:TetR/AcrR family transcriptional regulator n=1 Tax=Parapedobacter tibetensis TaxID=2972951 RepID=UPI00214D4526|nr:TetR/AcrR family transcriptional regulator [Parapedobacter tibetensis]